VAADGALMVGLDEGGMMAVRAASVVLA
jgi:hypothetical protein